MTSKSPIRVYCSQYGATWRLTPGNWRKLVRHAAAGNPYTLDDYGDELQRLAPVLYRDGEGRVNSKMTAQYPHYHTLQLTQDDFIEIAATF